MIDENIERFKSMTLNEYIRQNGLLKPKDAAKLLLPLVKAISELHIQGEIHRNISLENIYINDQGKAELAVVESSVTLGGMGIGRIECPPQFHNIPPIHLPPEID